MAQTLCLLETDGNGLLTDTGDGTFGPGCYAGRPGFGEKPLEVNYAGPSTQAFINPPYNRGEVIKWVLHYRHTNFTFLLKWAPDTRWFTELIGYTTHVWFPVDERIEFEPPPGVSASSNPFPHALYLKNPPPGRLQRLATRGLVVEVTPAWLDNLARAGIVCTREPGDLRPSSAVGGEGAALETGAGGRGSRAKARAGRRKGTGSSLCLDEHDFGF